jgi:peptide-methionine (R)-S-oxide reductase
MEPKIKKTEAEWRALLDEKTYKILRKKETEYAFTGPYWDNHTKGKYYCAGCGALLFDSETKFDSGTGWPSFHSPAKKENLVEETDITHGMKRTEVLCKNCGGHLGHLFDDGPKPTGQRYCINSFSLKFKEIVRSQNK